MDRTSDLTRHRCRSVRFSPTFVATLAVVVGCGAVARVLGLGYMNTPDVLGYDFGQTPGAYLAYEFLFIGAMCALACGVVTRATYAWQRRSARPRIARRDVMALAALVVLLSTVWLLMP
ncbi:hypothetical protein [Mobilicoccus pelagius]|uniref:Uncharacterized protein n=1 Tax=Mobilicoccus pelagius NBRC 104925 TaxID=1089455 RepID=H5UNH9_9MICO|nr:hypothetical protein [Mobilicoccus pelagius]GAB47287.1 hypothetical protein MOPEL_007_01030 [Mobilicoccus pelagius NBRC 104925]